MNEPIITSLLDNDLYKFKMLYFLWKMKLTETKVSYTFFNRSNITLDNINVNKLQDQVYHLFSLKFSYSELKRIKEI